MNLDERIEAMLFDYSSAFDQHDNETTKPLIKQLISEVLEYVKPTEKGASEVASDEDERRSYFTAKNAYLSAIDEMEAKIKELGL